MNKLLLILLLFTTPLFATDPGYEAEPSPLRTLYSSSTGQGGYITNFKAPTEKLQIKAGNGVDLQKTGHLGNATEFNGVAWAEITGATHPIGLLNDYTLVIAHKSTDTTTGLDGEPYSESINIGGSTVKDRLILTYGSTTMTYRFIYDVASGTDTDTSFSVTKDTNYHMYVARRSGTTFTTKFDNVAKTSQTVSASTISGINRICFGINCSLVVGTGSDQWKGQLDEVYI